MGTVYEAEEQGSGRRVALKLLAPHAASSPEALERFRQEGRLASQIAHPRCVFVFGADEEADRPYIIMELMPGATLRDLVEKQGPLPPEEAVAKILDVIEGLQEAHHRGVIHRDVKPSNCFVLQDGRVKVGDFGLAKSLVGDAHLTQSGMFLGTPLFASPEQIKGEAIDPQTDVYSVSATLYYLLTGKAPFERGTTTATLARIVSEAPPPVRSLRPEVPAALDRVILRGLERQRERRLRNLEELRAALLPFLPGQLPIGGLGMRAGAYLLDAAVFLPFWVVTASLFMLWSDFSVPSPTACLVKYLVDTVPWLVYFVLLEGLWGASLGKWLLGLRVCRVGGHDPPGLRAALLRMLAFYGVVNVVADVFEYVFVIPEELTRWDTLALAAQGVGILLLIAPMRASNGYRGLHELLSGTRVVALLPPSVQPLRSEGPRTKDQGPKGQKGQTIIDSASFGVCPSVLGPFRILSVLDRHGDELLLLGADTALKREVWIHLRPATAPALTLARQELTRPTRLRWLTSGRLGEQQWDAFVAPSGCPFPDWFDGKTRLTWPQTRLLLQQLADELAAAAADGTLPPTSLEQVWVRPDLRLQLADWKTSGTRHCRLPTDDSALALVANLATLALEGRQRSPLAEGEPLKAPVPPHAARMVHRLLGFQERYEHLGQLQADLAASRNQPAEVTMEMRAAHLGLLVTFLSVGLIFMLLPTRLFEVAAVRTLTQHIVRANRALEGQTDSELMASLRRISPDRAGQPDALARLKRTLADRRDDDKRQRWIRGQWLGRLLKAFAFLDTSPPLDPTQQGPQQREETDKAIRHALPPAMVEEPDLDSPLATALPSIGWPIVWVVWAFVTRGGFTLRMMGISLRRADGRKASRWQCAWRALLVWAPVSLLLGLAVWVQRLAFPGIAWLYWGLWWSAVGLLAVYVVLALWSPTRALHDRLAGTYLVPA
jgi:uncharacterized RDD family membrane protein YckC